MKKYLIILCSLILSASCEENDTANHHSLSVLNSLDGEAGLTYTESLNKWTELKGINGNSYLYHILFTSFSGREAITELRVENGVITSRTYQEYITPKSGRREITDSYHETAEDLGKHEMGAKLLTIDDLYDTCATDYLTVSPETNTIYFETAQVGLLTTCGFVPGSCVDDCFTGVRITAFDWLD